MCGSFVGVSVFVCVCLSVSACGDNNENLWVLHTAGNLLSFISELRRLTSAQRPKVSRACFRDF